MFSWILAHLPSDRLCRRSLRSAGSPSGRSLPAAKAAHSRTLSRGELRMQEDKIYAMEDYLTQYQQLVCKYRSENTALRRRLADEYYDGELPEPQKVPRADGERTTPPGGTSIEIRETPGVEGEQQPSREIDIELPDVPPLEGSTSSESSSTQVVVAAAHHESSALDYGEAASAAGKSHQKSSGKVRAQAIIDPSRSSESQDEKHQQSEPDSKAPLRLHGEVVANDLGAGPRLVVNVESTDDFQNDAAFDGNVSLMLLANNGADGEQKLARWDFGSEDVQAAKEAGIQTGSHAVLSRTAGRHADPGIHRIVGTAGDERCEQAACARGHQFGRARNFRLGRS